jgi:hypothetical protein
MDSKNCFDLLTGLIDDDVNLTDTKEESNL